MRALLALAIMVVSTVAVAQNSPPVGNQFPVQPARTSSYTIKQSDLKSVIPFNCSSPCTVTFPQVTSSWPKGYPVLIESIGSATVTISANTSTLYGMPLTSGSIVLLTLGNFAWVTADPSNNYFASGFTGSGGSGVTLVARNGGGTVGRNGGGSVARN